MLTDDLLQILGLQVTSIDPQMNTAFTHGDPLEQHVPRRWWACRPLRAQASSVGRCMVGLRQLPRSTRLAHRWPHGRHKHHSRLAALSAMTAYYSPGSELWPRLHRKTYYGADHRVGVYPRSRFACSLYSLFSICRQEFVRATFATIDACERLSIAEHGPCTRCSVRGRTTQIVLRW